ncbi:cupin domain-containing protein [Streptomyces bauhiniae]|uniref:AraC family transcriptional regulator n=1 Tax=Streptomyces bauhiniae TaxID=2340725 RepID=UPI00366300D0
MDVLSDQLARARARGAVFSALRRTAPWGLGFGGRRPLTAHILLEGSGWLEAEGRQPAPLAAGDVVLAAEGAPYRLVSDLGAAGEAIADARMRGDDPPGPGQALILCGAYVVEGSVGEALLGSLPRFVQVPVAQQSARHREAIELLAREAAIEGPGQQVLLDRLLDLNLVYALRAWWHGDERMAPGWYRGLGHPGLARAISAVHERPQHPWTLEEMAHTAAMSRSGFAATFKAVVGRSPARYLTELRMGRAEDALLRTDATVAAIAAQAGYRNEFAFSTAFRRSRGLAPGQWRAARRGPLAQGDRVRTQGLSGPPVPAA